MEYDRALYRVYERIIEDLSMSSNPMETPSSSNSSSGNNGPLVAVIPSSSSSVNSRGSGSLRRRGRNTPNRQSAEEDGTMEHHGSSSVNNTNINIEEEPAPTDTNRNRRRRRQRRARQNRARQQQQQQIPTGLSARRTTQSQVAPLPFIVPIWMAKKMNDMSNNRNNNTNSNLAFPTVANHNGYISGAWRNFRNLLPGRGNRSSYESVATTTAQQLSIYQYSPGSSPSNHRDSIDNLGHTTPPRDVEQMYIGEEGLSLPTLDENNLQSSPSSRSSEGLRRRTSPSTPTGRARSASTNSSSPPSFPNSPNLSSASSSSSSGGERGPNSPPTVSLTQRAIQLQMRQARLHSRGGSSEIHTDSDNESYDSDALSNDDSSSIDGDDSSSSSSSYDTNNERNETGCSQKNIYGVMRLSFVIGIFHLFVLTALHVTYIGPYAFRKPGMFRLSSARKRLRSLAGRVDRIHTPVGRQLAFLRNLLEDEMEEGQNSPVDQTLINCISYALSTRPDNERSRYYSTFGDSDSSKKNRQLSAYNDIGDDDGIIEMISQAMRTNTRALEIRRSIAESESESSNKIPIVGKDEIVQIKIMYGGKCTGQCSRVRNVDYSNTTIENDSSATKEKIRLLDKGLRGNPFSRTTNNRRSVEEINKDIYSSPAYWEEPHYRFSMDDALLYLDEKVALLHNISIVNVTVTERCLSTGEDDGKLTFFNTVGEFFSQIYGMDSVIINQFMYGIRGSSGSLQSGYLQNMETKERWGWTKQQLESYEGNESVVDWIFRKIGALLLSLLAFFLVTTVTSLIVRVLTSSGVVLMFPLFSFFRSLGMRGADERILALSYPWIGSARMAIANRQIHPQNHLIWAHVSKILLYYVMYEACQAAWSVVVYAKSIPEALPVWIYGLAMILEYFSMVFVRSAMSAHFFPRISLLYFLGYHLYFYSVPYGFFDVALIPLFMFLVHAMLYTILAFEVCAASGVISVETPREVYNKLSWPEWSANLPSEWTMFLPLNARHIPLHDRVTEEVNGTQRNDVETVQN
ncbi:hypothetical protein ACHAWT_002462 [Skeletonema menzelii]